MLTLREFQIVDKLLTKDVQLKTKDLAEEFKVSSRTIQYDLVNVRYFLKQHAIAIHSKSSKGIWIEATDEKKSAAKMELDQQHKSSFFLEPQTRIHFILLCLLFTEGYMTAGKLAERLGVSRNTILNGIDQTQNFLLDSGLTLRRQPRQGYRLDGRELALRTLAENLVQENLSMYDIYQMIDRIKTGKPNESTPPILSSLAQEDYQIIVQTMYDAYLSHKDVLQEENVVRIVIRLLISVVRTRMKRYVGNSYEKAETDSHYMCQRWKMVYDTYGQPLLRDELDYILGQYQKELLTVDADALCGDLVDTLCKTEDFPYHEDKTLYPRLLAHIRSTFSSDKKTASVNPFNDLVLKNHTRLYESIRTVCKSHVDSAYLFANDSFVSNLALHFLASQRSLGIGRKVRVVFVCATGQGAARLLEHILEEEVRRLEVVQHCSLNAVSKVVEISKPDFIVSVFPIKSDLPVVIVEPLPTRANIREVKAMVDYLVQDDDVITQDDSIALSIEWKKQEDLCQKAILIGLKIYSGLRDNGFYCVKKELEISFLAHVMLLANRYVFGQQLDTKAMPVSDLDRSILQALTTIGIYLTGDEIHALTYYLDKNTIS